MSEGQGHPEYLWWDGERRRWEEATVHVTDLAWSAVGAVFEGIRAYWDERAEELYVFRLREHLERLVRSTKLLRLPFPYTVAGLTEETLALLRANGTREDTYIRPLVYTPSTGSRRFSQIGAESSTLINTDPMPTHLGTGLTQRAKVSSWTRISDNVMPPRAKNISNYRNGMLASQEARLDGYDTAILLNPQGKVAEGPGACVVFVRDGKVYTPDTTSGNLESVTRDALLTLAREVLGVEVVERVVDRTELYTADEVFTCGTAAEITPIVEIDHYEIGDGAPGPITRALEGYFHMVLRGREDRYGAWRTPVWVGAAVPA